MQSQGISAISYEIKASGYVPYTEYYIESRKLIYNTNEGPSICQGPKQQSDFDDSVKIYEAKPVTLPSAWVDKIEQIAKQKLQLSKEVIEARNEILAFWKN